MKKTVITFLLGMLFAIVCGQTTEQLIDKAESYAAAGDNLNAEKVTKQILDADPDHPRNYILWSNLGTFQRSSGKLKEALKSYDKSIKLNSSFAMAYTNRAKLYTELKEDEKAHKDYMKAMELEPDNETTLFYLGMRSEKEGDHVTARKYLETLISKYPENYGAASNLANIKKRQGEYAEALTDFNKLVESHPEDAILYNNRADLFIKMKQYDNAMTDVDKALEIDPEYLVAIITKGEIYFEQNDFENACRYFNSAISKGFQKERIATYMEKCK